MRNIQFQSLPMTEDVPLNSQLITNNPVVPDPEVKTTKPRRRFTAKYKLSILAEVDACIGQQPVAYLLQGIKQGCLIHGVDPIHFFLAKEVFCNFSVISFSGMPE